MCSTTPVHLLLRSLHLEHPIADELIRKVGERSQGRRKFVRQGSTSDNDVIFHAVINMSDAEVVNAVHEAVGELANKIKIACHKATSATSNLSAHSQGGQKFVGDMGGGTIEDFYKGVTGIVGQPEIDLERGLKKEHLHMPDSDKEFTTTNYGITTSPSREFELMRSGGEGQLEMLGPDTGVMRKRVSCRGRTGAQAAGAGAVVEDGRAGSQAEELRVLRPLSAFGKFREDGQLDISVGDDVRVVETIVLPDSDVVALKSGRLGTVAHIDQDTLEATIDFEEPAEQRVLSHKDCSKLRPRRGDTDSEVVQKVSQADLTRVEVWSVVLYTGPMFLLYNGILRGLGSCGVVDNNSSLWSGSFKKQIEAETIEARMAAAGHKFASTIHCLASAVKKLQRISTGRQGTKLYRGLGGLCVEDFVSSNGFTETAFTSTTESLDVALEYSGVRQGRVATVLAMETSEVDQGADLALFSQYPMESETVWNACSYMEAVRGKDEIVLTDCGTVKLINVKMSANSRAQTIAELQARRRDVLANMLETVNFDVLSEVDAIVETEEFKARLAKDRRRDCEDNFLNHIRNHCRDVLKQFRERDASWYHDNRNFCRAVTTAASLPDLARAWIQGWLEDENGTLCVSHRFVDSTRRLKNQRWRRYKQARSIENNEDAIKLCALQYCAAEGWVRDETVQALHIVDEESGQTPIITKSADGDSLAVKLLLQAHADASDKTRDDTQKTALHWAAERDCSELVRLLAKDGRIDFRSQHGRSGYTPMHVAAYEGHSDALKAMIDLRADLEAGHKNGGKILHVSFGHAAIIRLLVDSRANIESRAKESSSVPWGTPLLQAAVSGTPEAVRALLEARANIESKTACKLHPKKGQLTALLLAVQKKNMGVLKVLVEFRASLEARDSDSRTAYHLAVQDGSADVLSFLLEARADPEAVDAGQRTAVHLAAAAEKADCFKLAFLRPDGLNSAATFLVGEQIGFEVAEGGDLRILRIVPGGAAESWGVQPGWTVTHVAETDVRSMSFEDAFRELESWASSGRGSSAREAGRLSSGPQEVACSSAAAIVKAQMTAASPIQLLNKGLSSPRGRRSRGWSRESLASSRTMHSATPALPASP